MTVQQLANMITSDLTSAKFRAIGVLYPQTTDEVEDSYCINVGKMHERRDEKDKRVFGFDVIGLDITVKNLTLISIVYSGNCYIRILLSTDYRGWYAKELYGSNEEDVIMQTMLKIGFLKGFVAILSRRISHRFTYNEDYLIEVTDMFINRSECDGLRNLLHADWAKLCKDYVLIGEGGLAWLPNPVKIDMEHLRGLQRLNIDSQIEVSVELGHQECTAILLKFKNEILGNNEEDTIVL